MVAKLALHLIAAFIAVYNAENLIAVSENSKLKFRISVSLIIHLIATVMFWASDNAWINIALMFVMYVSLAVRVCFRKNRRFSKAFYILMMYLSIDSLLASFIKFFIGLIDERIYKADALIATISAIIAFFIIKSLERKNITLETSFIPKHIYILIMLSLFFSGGLIEGQLPIWSNTTFGTLFVRILTAIVIVLLIIIIISLVFNCISKAYLQNTSSLLRKQVETQIEYYEKIGNLNNDLRSFRHDYKNHLICIGSLIDKKEYDEAREYIEKISGMNINTSKEFFSGNTIANAILNDKSEKADKSGIKIDFDGYIHKGISPTDICIILSNAIDNAIEACEKISGDEDRKISVNCSYSKGVQIISIKNPVPENVEIEDDSVKTSKEDKSIHGIGLYNIRNTIKKYGGEFNISCENKEFTLSVAFMPDTEDITS